MSFIIPIMVYDEAIVAIGAILIIAFVVMAWAFWRIANQLERFNDIYLHFKKEERRKAQNSPPPPATKNP
jgi:hypothetical protein